MRSCLEWVLGVRRLKENHIGGDIGAAALAKGLQHCPKLESLE